MRHQTKMSVSEVDSDICHNMTQNLTLMFMVCRFIVNNKMQELKIEKVSRNIRIF